MIERRKKLRVARTRPEGKEAGGGHEGKKKVKFSPRDTPGVICIERHIHDEAVVISGSLIIEHEAADVNAWIEEEVGRAAREVRESGGVIGHIEAALTVSTTSMITVTDEGTSVRESPQKFVRIVLAAIIFLVAPKEAEGIIRKALAGVRSRLRDAK